MPKAKPQPRQTPTHLKDLVADPTNRRLHNPRNIGMVVDALHKVGAARSIVIDEDNVVLAGNGVAEAAAEAGITKVRVIDADGDELIAVRRTGLSADQKRDLAIYDNRTAELAEWDGEQLRSDIESGLSLEPFFTSEEVIRVSGGATFDTVELPTIYGGNKDFLQMTFVLHRSEADTVREAIAAGVLAVPLDSGVDVVNRNRNGRALAEVCRVYLRRS